jgi:hypothetical protein
MTESRKRTQLFHLLKYENLILQSYFCSVFPPHCCAGTAGREEQQTEDRLKFGMISNLKNGTLHEGFKGKEALI